MSVYANGFLMRNSTITIDEVDYPNQCTKARLVPDTPTQSLRTLVPDGAIVDTDSTVWTFEVTGVQPKVLAGSLWAALHTGAGTQLDVVLAPFAGTGNAGATFTIIAAPVDFGGDQGAINTWDASFLVVGQPVFAAVSDE